jgi:DNA polymerase V
MSGLHMRVVAIYKLDCTSQVRFPLYNCPISAGSPSFGDDCVDEYINLRDLVKHPDRCFLLRVFGDSMIGVNIHSGSLLVVDRMVEPMNGDVAIAVINGDLTLSGRAIG